MSTLRGDTPVQYLKGVGPRRAEAFARLGLHTVADLLEYLPFRYERFSSVRQIALVRDGERVTISGEVADIDIRPGRCVIRIFDGSAACELIWFNPNARPRGVTSSLSKYSQPGWHNKRDNHAAGFLDGHAVYRKFDTQYIDGPGWTTWPARPWVDDWAPYNEQ